jgi:hypothetical protein
VLQLRNPTGLAATAFASADPDGVDTLYAVVKGTFALGPHADGGEPPLAAEQAPVAAAATHHGDPAASSIRMPSDLSLVKPGTDVLLTGRAYAPGDRPTTEMLVTLAAGPLRRAVRVVGDRVWRRRDGWDSVSDPAPFVRMPLVWERAFGGTDVAGGAARAEPRNPVGTGYREPDGARPLEGLRLPNLEDPARPVLATALGPVPACFAPVAEHWMPRRGYAGTYDEAWQRRRAPYLPADFDPRFFQLAPPELVAPGYLTGGEPVEVTGATPDGALRFAVPRLAVEVTFVVDGESRPRPARLDTVLVQPDNRRVLLTWRAALACDKRILRVEEIRVAAERAA